MQLAKASLLTNAIALCIATDDIPTSEQDFLPISARQSLKEEEFLLVIGGQTDPGVSSTNEVELISLDPAGSPVPECLRGNLSSYPSGSVYGASAGLSSGNILAIQGGSKHILNLAFLLRSK